MIANETRSAEYNYLVGDDSGILRFIMITNFFHREYEYMKHIFELRVKD